MLQATVRIPVGGTLALTTATMDTTGARPSTPPLTWSSSNSAVAVVSSTGVVTGVSPGTVVITVRDAAGNTATIVVVVGATPIGDTTCVVRRPEWLWCDDFESDRLSSYTRTEFVRGRFRRVTGEGRSGSTAMADSILRGTTRGGALRVAIGRVPRTFTSVARDSQDFRELFARVFVRHSRGWTGINDVSRLPSITSVVTANGAQSMLGWARPEVRRDTVRRIAGDPVSGTTASGTRRTRFYDDGANWRFLGRRTGTRDLFLSPAADNWQCIEMHVRLNDSTQSNGVLEIFVNDSLEVAQTNLNFTGRLRGFGLNLVALEDAWTREGAPRPQMTRFFDDLIVSTARIGCR